MAMVWEQLVEKLGMQAHPEGGFFVETYRADEEVAGGALPARFSATPRAFSTAILFLIPAGHVSALHRIAQDEVWHFYAGSPLVVEVLTDGEDGPSSSALLLGSDLFAGQAVQGVVKAGAWFGAHLADEDAGPEAYALVGCTVAPGFDFADFELAKADEMVAKFASVPGLDEALLRRMCAA
ncbi:uncharacterized protein AMSG_05794 [Thecamonas trahens ATCC 50062]|uniref:DUF985 domain-containing protein n=1 Tax=Thecamonas trahens ATCC 50062 TaxID=461836 RepID=A0A0L0DCH0_THETB|nr:hypothetical protein AMSG_05794 [Thecamonas trahens ATCC 50062]KNC50034.1 hypothetical protein AMSG_05794 [Thecamonas trahens ATCC 50062]|eukprot:XP_013757201.1 hypothetical protein AMSG_05794 [Thecamonas trahens ATCC 50062]